MPSMFSFGKEDTNIDLIIKCQNVLTSVLSFPLPPKKNVEKIIAINNGVAIIINIFLLNERPQVAILDFGSQYSHLIARRVRELHVYCELYSCLVTAAELEKHSLVAIILSGGPSSVYEEGAPHVSSDVWKLIEERNIPVLGICYGMQELAHVFGGTVAPGLKHEYGKAMVQRVAGCDSKLFDGMPSEFQMWMSHGDKLTKTPEGFKPVGTFLFVLLSSVIICFALVFVCAIVVLSLSLSSYHILFVN